MPKRAKEKLEELNNKKNNKINVSTTKKKTTKNEIDKTSKSKSMKQNKLVNKTRTSNLNKSNNAVKNKNTTTKSNSKTRAKSISKISPVLVTEYYDLPFRYNQTTVKILAQTPNTLFIYWDISDEDKNSYIEKYGNNFFDHTRPYLIITNTTMNYSFEVEINDFANSWYLHINDADCEYKLQLVRKFIVNSNNTISLEEQQTSNQFETYKINDYIYITSSNEIESPNNHILFDKLGSSVFFRNVKTNITEEKDISSISFLQKIGKVYNVYDLYKELYKEDLLSDEFGLDLPSSNSIK